MVARILMVVAAASLVSVFALATFIPTDMPLGQFLLQQDRGSLQALRAAVAALPSFVWPGIVVPVLLRPTWLAPLMLGIVALGGAISFRTRAPGAGRPRAR
jgi:hypothetical protein